jgi:hypothetical protein
VFETYKTRVEVGLVPFAEFTIIERAKPREDFIGESELLSFEPPF